MINLNGIKGKMREWEIHDSQRGYFAYHLYLNMVENEKVWLLTGDLGFKMFDQHFEDLPGRCVNTGASEQSLFDIAVGLALEGKIPFCYSITPFLLWRPAETIRLYLNHESIPVKLVGSGRDEDYSHDGFSHNARDTRDFLKQFPNIVDLWPNKKEEIGDMVKEMVENGKPTFISLTR